MAKILGELPETVEKRKRRSFLIDVIVRLVKEKPLGTIGAIIVILMLLTGIFANYIAPYEYADMSLANTLLPPSSQHTLGTDQLGRDLLSRVIYGARISMIVSLAGATLTTIIATVIGLFSGFLGGTYDLVIQRFVDGWMCFPPLFLVLSIMAILRPGMLQVIVVLGLLGGISNSRVVRSAVIGIRENLYVEAAKAVGAPTRVILWRHIFPNIMAPVIIIYTLAMGNMIILEATISFLGFGIPPPVPSWGGMLSGEGRVYMYQAPGLAIWPGLALGIAVFGVNMLGDGIRDILDPKLRGGLARYGRMDVKKALSKRAQK